MSASQIGLVLLVACVVAIISRRLRLPYSAGLVAAGIMLSLLPGFIRLSLGPDLIYNVLLPPLIFEASLQLKWRPFRNELPVTLMLAFPGVLITGAIVAAGMHWALGWGWRGAAIFGALIAATDPVSVISAFKEMNVQPRLSLLVEAESLLNDGSAAVAFAIVVLIAQGAVPHAGFIVISLVWMVLGGLVVGAAVAGAALLMAGRTNDHLVETTLTTIAAYGSFLLANHLHMSGVLASLAAGLVIGNVGWRGPITDTSRDYIVSFWEYVAFLANSVIFILIGEANEARLLFTGIALAAIVTVLVGRVAAVYPLCAGFARSRWRVSMHYQHVLVWGGLHGGLALALALAVPDNVPERSDIITATFAVVAFSVFAQGLTMPWLIKVFQLRQPAPTAPGD